MLEAALPLQRARHERRIDGDDARAPLEQHPGPAAGRGAEIDADVAGVGRAIEPQERFGELHRGARRRGVGHVHAQAAARRQARRVARRHDADGDAIARRQQARLRVEAVVGERGARVGDALVAPTRAATRSVAASVGGALRRSGLPSSLSGTQTSSAHGCGAPVAAAPRRRRAELRAFSTTACTGNAWRANASSPLRVRAPPPATAPTGRGCDFGVGVDELLDQVDARRRGGS